MFSVDGDPNIHRAFNKAVMDASKTQSRLSATLDDVVLVGIVQFVHYLPDTIIGPDGPIDTRDTKRLVAALGKPRKK